MASFLDRTAICRAPDPEEGQTDDPQWGVLANGIRLIALRAVGDQAQAEEIAQESVTRAIASLATTREKPIVDLGGFVYGIARHLIADAHRTRGRTVPLDAVAEPESPSASALEAVIADEEGCLVRNALAELSPADRDLLRLFFVEGLDADEIGRRLDEPAVNIRKRKSRALVRLRLIFGGHDGPASATGRP